MKKIETKQDKAKKQKRNNLILVIVMVALIGLSSLGYAIMSQSDSNQKSQTSVYGGVKFVESNGYWVTELNGKQFYFNSLPSDLENVSITGNYSFKDYYQKPVYIINSNPAVSMLIYSLQDITLRVQEACFEGEECLNDDLPTKSCSDNVVIFRDANAETKITKQENCVFIDGNFFEGVDKLVYRMLNIA